MKVCRFYSLAQVEIYKIMSLFHFCTYPFKQTCHFKIQSNLSFDVLGEIWLVDDWFSISLQMFI